MLSRLTCTTCQWCSFETGIAYHKKRDTVASVIIECNTSIGDGNWLGTRLLGKEAITNWPISEQNIQTHLWSLLYFCFKFKYSLSLTTQVTKSQYCFRWWLGAELLKIRYLNLPNAGLNQLYIQARKLNSLIYIFHQCRFFTIRYSPCSIKKHVALVIYAILLAL